MPYAGMGGSPVPVAFTERASKLGIKVYRSYGSTEQPSITGSHVDEPEQKRLTTDGRPLARRRGDARRGRPDSQPWSRPLPRLHGSGTQRLGVRRRTGGTTRETWACSTQSGYLTITDRISDIIIRGGENISAQEVEELLLGIDARPGGRRRRRARRPPRRTGSRDRAHARRRPHRRPWSKCVSTLQQAISPSRNGPSRFVP